MWKLRQSIVRAPEDDAAVAAAAPSAAASHAAEPSKAPASAPTPAAPAPAAASPAPAATSVEETPPVWPADWRERVSRDDAKILTRMQRYASPEALAEALIHAQNRISSGELKPVLGKNATPEQLAEWRQANGIPAKPTDYDLGRDLVADATKPLADKYLEVAHAANMTPDQVKASLKFFNAMNAEKDGERAEEDARLQAQYEEELRGEWGKEFKANVTAIKNLLNGATTPDFYNQVLGARLPNGTPIGSSPDMLRLLLKVALADNPAATLVTGANDNPMRGIEDAISEIEKVMRTDRQKYDKDEKMQARYRDLIDARMKLQERK